MNEKQKSLLRAKYKMAAKRKQYKVTAEGVEKVFSSEKSAYVFVRELVKNGVKGIQVWIKEPVGWGLFERIDY